MDPLHFSIKRVYWSSHARIGELLAPLGITPARADLLRLVAMHEHGIGQWKLTQQLGVSAPTISKMLTAMAERGWVERFAAGDGTNIVHATHAGLVLIAQVIQRLVLSGAVRLRTAVAWGHGNDAEADWAALFRMLNRARRAFLDRAPFFHPWRNDETYVRGKYTFWEARLDADDIDELIVEDIDAIRERAKERIACEPPPRTTSQLKNIAAHRHDRHDAPPRLDDLAPAIAAAPLAAKDQGPEAEGLPAATPTDVAASIEEAVATERDVIPPLPIDAVTFAEVADRLQPTDNAPAIDTPPSALPAPVIDVAPDTVRSVDATIEREGASGDDDIPPALAALWKNLVELTGAHRLSADDAPKWNETD